MRKCRLGRRVISLVLTFTLVFSLIASSVLAAVNDISTGDVAGKTGIVNDSVGNEGSINWPIKIYDYLADGMLFEYSSFNGAKIYDESYSAEGGGLYGGGEPMPRTKLGSDFTGDWIYSAKTTNSGSLNNDGTNPSHNYTKTKKAAVANSSPQYMRLTRAGDNGYANFCVGDFVNDWGGGKAAYEVRYMVVVYRSSGITANGSTPAFHLNSITEGAWRQMKYPGTFQNSSSWTYMLIDLREAYNSYQSTLRWDNISGKINKIYIRLSMDSTSDYFDLSHVGFFGNPSEAEQYAKAAVAFDKNPGTKLTTASSKSSSSGWNAGNNLGFGMLLPSSGGNWALGGGSNSLNNGYNTYRVGYNPYTSGTGANSATFNTTRVDRNGKTIGDSNKIYYVASTFSTHTDYKAKYPEDYVNGFNTADLDLDGYSLLTHATQGLMTIGLLEGKLENGRPVYREEAISYIAEMLEKTLVIPQKDSSGKYNYNFVKGQTSSQYGTSNGKNLDIAQALRNCLGITFTSGQNKGSAPTFGSYSDTKAKSDKLIGEFLDCKDNIKTCMDAAYYLLNNIFVDNSYNQLQTDYKYLTLSSAEMSTGKKAYVFDAGFSNGADNADLTNGTLTQDQYKSKSQSAVEYSSLNEGGDGTVSINTVQAKDMFYYSDSAITTRFPFLPVTNATGDYAGQTKSYYMMEDGYRSYTKDGGTYINRNFNYVLASNGEFVFNEEDGLFFEFEGDDDVYLFINNQLVLDLGGAHSISNVSFNVNDYVQWAREVVANPSNYTEEEVERAEALDLVDGEIAKFDFYYMERHGYGANMRIVTNMRITDPALRVDKTAYQFGEKVEVGGIVNPNAPIEYNFGARNTGNTKLYNLTFDDSYIGVRLNPEEGLVVRGDDTPNDVSDDINGYYVKDARGGTLEANDITAEVTGYFPAEEGNCIKDPTTGVYVEVEEGTGTHSYSTLTVHFDDNEALKRFLKTLDAAGLDDGTIDDEHTQSGSGLWVESYVCIKGIYYVLDDEKAEAGTFDNTVNVTATTKSNPNVSGNETLKSSASHRVYIAGIPYYYQWAEHNLFVAEKRILDDATQASRTSGNKLSEYEEFFDKVKGDTNVIYTSFCDKYGKPVSYSPDVQFYTQKGDNDWGCLINYKESGTKEFYLLMRLQTVGSDVSKLNQGEYAIVRVMVYVTETHDSTFVLDYGLKTQELDANGELFKNDNMLGAQSGTLAKLMGVNTTGATYLDPKDNTTEYNRIDFDKMPLDEKNKIDVRGDDGSVDGYYTFNMNIPDNGKIVSYNSNNGTYSLSDVGTVPIHVQVPIQWKQAYLYYWYDGGSDNGWPGTLMNLDKTGHFSLSIPGDVPHIIISNGQQQTMDIDINPGEEAWVTIDGTTNSDNLLLASVDYHTQDGIIHAQVPDDWEEVYLYYWDEYNNNNEWPGEKLELDEDGFYTMYIPGNVHFVILNNGDNGKQTSDQPVYAGKETWITVNNNNPSYNEETNIYYYEATSSRSTESITVHAKVPDTWGAASLYYWNSNGSGTGVTWPGIPMTKQDDGYYVLENVPADVTNVIINDGKESGGQQTEDLLITPGLETWIDISYKDFNVSVEATVPQSYSDVYFYFFNDVGRIGASWPGTKVTETTSSGAYKMKAPAGATKVIINNGSGMQTQDLVLTNESVNKFTVENNGKVNTKLLITVPDGWGTVSVYNWNDSENNGWPGDTVTERDTQRRYVYTFDGSRTGFNINNTAGLQTADITSFYHGRENIVKVNSDGSYNISMASTPLITENKIDINYGEDAEKIGFTFTPVDFMDSKYNLWMAFTVHETSIEPTPLGQEIDSHKEVQMFKKVTVLPASVVYYEDDFAGIKYDTTNTTNTMVHVGDGSGKLSQSVDQNIEYGKDSTYADSLKSEYSGNSQTQVTIKDRETFAGFEFKGTGFEIIGRTNAIDSSTVRVVVKDEHGNIVRSVFVVTEFDNSADNDDLDAINQVPIVRVNGLDYGKYSVEINGVPVYDFTNMVDNKPSVKDSWIIIDGIRIFQPLDNSDTAIGGINLSLNKSVEVIDADRGYNANLTDGVYATSINFDNKSEWFGFNKDLNATGGVGYITVDLGKEYNLDTFRMHLSEDNTSANVGQPASVDVLVSSDGVEFKSVGNLNVLATTTSAYWATLETSSNAGRYVRFAVYNNATGLYWNILNEVEVYGSEIVAAGKNDSYLDTENGASFAEVRNLISDRQTFAVKYDDMDGLSVSGGTNTWIENRNNTSVSNENISWTNNIVNSVSDYLLAGPNNEVYMTEVSDSLKSALVLYVQEEGDGVHNLQIAARAVDQGLFNGKKATGLSAKLQYGIYVNGSYRWRTLATVTSGTEQYYTIPYKYCPYDEVNDRYQVVIRIADTDTPGMASFSTVKYNGITLCTLNTSEVPDVIYNYEEIGNTIVDSTGKTLETSKFVDFIGLVDQMASNKDEDDKPEEPVTPSVTKGVDTSALGELVDEFIDSVYEDYDYNLTTGSKFYIVIEDEYTPPSNALVETVQLAQSQFAADSLPTSEPIDLVWGVEDYVSTGDIAVYLEPDATYLDDEGYVLEVTDVARVYAKDINGVLYGLNTLQKHFRKAGTTAIDGFRIVDAPDTKERIVHLDVARKYLTKNWIENYIAEMSWMGYNTLEFHMSEDGGFRSDIWSADTINLPGMSGNDFSWAVGSRKQTWAYSGGNDVDANRYLTTEELISICETAKKYHIDIVPSFDTPAHVDYITKIYAEKVAAGNTSIKTFKYNGTTYTLPNKINYASGMSALNLGNNAVKNLAYAMYNDMAVFFKTYAGSTKFNIGGDELGLYSGSGFTYTDVYNYINNVNSVLKSHGYRSRVYNDFFYRNSTVDSDAAIYQTSAKLDSDIDVVIWTTEGKYTRPAADWVNEGRTVYGGMNYWTYYVLRYFDDPSYSTDAQFGKDARDPSNSWWSFYRNTEDAIYNEWTPGLLSGYNANEYELTNSKLGGGYFMVWCDNATVNTEVEMWNGVWDKSTSANNGKYYYSLMERMWSNAIKQWNWDIDSSLKFANYEPLRDSMGAFPGYVATPSSVSYAYPMSLPQATDISDISYRPSYTVEFLNYDGTVLDTQSVRHGDAAVDPVGPAKPSDDYYKYNFIGWSEDYTYITRNTTIKPVYEEVAIVEDNTGYLELKVSGGTDIRMSVNSGPERSQGTHYINQFMPFGEEITVTAVTTNDNAFDGWMNALTGEILTKEATYTFYTSGNDVLIAMFSAKLTGMNTVTFKNTKNNQIIDIQYYTSNSDISFPEDPTFVGYEFAGWDLTEQQIKEKLSQGKDVVVNSNWNTKDVYVDITVKGGKISEYAGMDGDGKFLAFKTTVVVANDAAAGKYFSHWEDEEHNILSYNKEYKFYPYKDTELTAVYVSDTDLKIDIVGTKDNPVVKDTFDVYFTNNWLWTEVCIYYWGVDGSPSWPGYAMEKVGTDSNNHEVYKAQLPIGITGMIISGIKNDGSGDRDQTPNIIEFVDGRGYSMTWNNGNQVVTDDSKVVGTGDISQIVQTNKVYLKLLNNWKDDENAVFTSYVWNESGTEYKWYNFTHVSGDIYVVDIPVKYNHIILASMNLQYDQSQWDINDTTGILLHKSVGFTVTAKDEHNMVILTAEGGYDSDNVYTTYFVNDCGLENITAYYTDSTGTYKTTVELSETDENGNDVYAIQIPANATRIKLTDGKNDYVYRNTENLTHGTIFQLVEGDATSVDDIAVHAYIDSTTLGDSNTIFYSWSVPETDDFTFVRAGVLFSEGADYSETTLTVGTLDTKVTQFVPTNKYQVSTNMHSVTKTDVESGDTMVARAFVIYRDSNNILRVAYSDIVTATK